MAHGAIKAISNKADRAKTEAGDASTVAELGRRSVSVAASFEARF